MGLVIETDGEVVSITDVTVCDSTGLVDVALAVSPLYFATMLSVPTGSVEDEHCAIPLLSVALQTELPFTVKPTVPVGDFRSPWP